MTHSLEEHIYVNWVVTSQVGWGRVGRGELEHTVSRCRQRFNWYIPRHSPSPCPYLFVFKGAGVLC
jgi:hypothetical protein